MDRGQRAPWSPAVQVPRPGHGPPIARRDHRPGRRPARPRAGRRVVRRPVTGRGVPPPPPSTSPVPPPVRPSPPAPPGTGTRASARGQGPAPERRTAPPGPPPPRHPPPRGPPPRTGPTSPAPAPLAAPRPATQHGITAQLGACHRRVEVHTEQPGRALHHVDHALPVRQVCPQQQVIHAARAKFQHAPARRPVRRSAGTRRPQPAPRPGSPAGQGKPPPPTSRTVR